MNYNKKLLLLLLLFYGCDNWIEGYDEDPNSSMEASIDNLFTASQVNIINFSENHLARTVAIWLQQMAGTDRQYKTLSLYTFEENDYSSSWQSIYLNGGLKDLRIIQSISDDDESPQGAHYKGMAQILEAYLVGTAASVWGDVPYSEAINESIDNPILDDQTIIYSSIQELLDEAILNLSSNDSTFLPQNDMFFDGDIEKWKAAAHTLKARFYMHWVEDDPHSNCLLALENADLGISTLDGSMKTLHTSESSEQNLWYQFDYSRSGYMTAGYQFVDLLYDNSDPRVNIYFENAEGKDVVVGAKPGDSYNKHSYLNDENFGADGSMDIISYEENLLIKAECNYRLGNEISAQTFLQESQTAAEDKWGFPSTTYSDITLTGEDLFDKIIEEKYIALFLNIEAWNDYKRNCYPDVKYKKSEDDDGNPIYERPPGRVYYPEDERKTNTNIPSITNQPKQNDNDDNECIEVL